MLSTIAAFVLFAVAAPQTPAPPIPTVSSPTEITAFVDALNSCEAATAATPHPLMRSFTVEHTITGAQSSGCGYSQTMPGRMKMVCTLSADGRKTLAAEISVYAKGGSISGSTSGSQPVWFSECELEMPDGKRQPMVAPGR
jgi:hypothetical protein